MESKGVTFNYKKGSKYPESFSISRPGGEEEYIHTIKSLLNLIRNCKDDMIDPEDIYYACTLIEHMLPTPDQIIVNEPTDNTPA